MANIRDKFCALFHPCSHTHPRHLSKNELLPEDLRAVSHGLRNDLSRLQARSRELDKIANTYLLDENLEGFFNQIRGVGHK